MLEWNSKIISCASQAALSNTGIPQVQVVADTSGEDQPEVDISDEEFLQFDTSSIPVIITLTKVMLVLGSSVRLLHVFCFMN